MIQRPIRVRRHGGALFAPRQAEPVRGGRCWFDARVGDLRGEFSPARALNHTLSCSPHFIGVIQAAVRPDPSELRRKT